MSLFDTSGGVEPEEPVSTGKTSMRCHTVRGKQIFDVRRFNSEATLLANTPWHFERGGTYHVISGGDVDSLTFLRHVVRQQHLAFCLVSSWCYGVEDVTEMGSWIERGAVDRFDFYCGEIAKASYALCATELGDIARRGGGRLGVFRNHSKVMCFYGDRFDGVITSSANVNTNPRTENTVITCVTEIADFYKAFFDDIHPFNHKDFEEFKPWTRN
jgi:hypothetical protein